MREGCYVREVRTNQRHSSVNSAHISCLFCIGLNAAKKTIAITTQKGIQHAIHPLNRRYRMDNLDLYCRKLKRQWYLDHLLAQSSSKNQNTGAYIYTHGHFTKA